MKHLRLTLFAIATLTQTAWSQDLLPGETIVPPDTFDAFSIGTTITYNRHDSFYGAEQHFEGRRVLWLRGDGTCSPGRWLARGDQICFTYEDTPGEEHCLHVIDNEKGRVHRFLGSDPSADLVMIDQSPAPLSCKGPEVGVSFHPEPAGQ